MLHVGYLIHIFSETFCEFFKTFNLNILKSHRMRVSSEKSWKISYRNQNFIKHLKKHMCLNIIFHILLLTKYYFIIILMLNET